MTKFISIKNKLDGEKVIKEYNGFTILGGTRYGIPTWRVDGKRGYFYMSLEAAQNAIDKYFVKGANNG